MNELARARSVSLADEAYVTAFELLKNLDRAGYATEIVQHGGSLLREATLVRNLIARLDSEDG